VTIVCRTPALGREINLRLLVTLSFSAFLEELSAQYRNMLLGDAIIAGRMFVNMAELTSNGKVWKTGLFAPRYFRFGPSTIRMGRAPDSLETRYCYFAALGQTV